jgi:hypothetical protein
MSRVGMDGPLLSVLNFVTQIHLLKSLRPRITSFVALVFLEIYGSFLTVTLVQSWVIFLSLMKMNGDRAFAYSIIELLEITGNHL